MTAVDVPADQRRAAPGDDWLLGVVLAVVTFWLFAQTLLNVIPGIQDSLGLGTTVANFAVSVTALMSGLFIVVVGGLADRLGRAQPGPVVLVDRVLGRVGLLRPLRRAHGRLPARVAVDLRHLDRHRPPVALPHPQHPAVGEGPRQRRALRLERAGHLRGGDARHQRVHLPGPRARLVLFNVFIVVVALISIIVTVPDTRPDEEAEVEPDLPTTPSFGS